MTYRELYQKARRELAAGGVESPGPDAAALAKRFFGLDRPALAVHGGESPFPDREAAFLRAVEQRAARRPLQYILGAWEFMGLTLSVGEGVLCPREDTAALVETLSRALKGEKGPAKRPERPLRGLDLCAGTGAVALGLCSLLPEIEITCVELSSQAFPYLERNLAAHPQYRVEAMKGDVLRPETAAAFPPGSLDFIASNPPYVRTGDLPGLQPEVQKEPAAALDGGADGLLFYRALAKLWAPLLKPGGILAVEIGEDQAADVSAIFSAQGLTDLSVQKDWAGLDRAVLCRR